MPEGDTVFRTAQRLDRALSGTVLARSELRVPAYADIELAGRVVETTISRGKHLLTRVGDLTLHTHLKMDGSWHIYRLGARWRSPGFQARVVLANASWQAIGFRLGSVDLVRREAEEDLVGHLGPDLLGPDWSVSDAVARLSRQPDRPIGAALLDQRNLAGIGNMYKAEILFLRGVYPARRVVDVSNLDQLLGTAHRLLVANSARAEQSTTGDLRRGYTHWVYNRAGEPCRRCGSAILSAALDADRRDQHMGSDPDAIDQDRTRTTFWCPSCQRE